MLDQAPARIDEYPTPPLSSLTRDHEMVPCPYLAKLSLKYRTQAECGAAIGLSASAVGQALQTGQCKKTTELAAAYIWTRDFEQKEVMALILIDPEKLKIVTDVIKMAGGKINEL